MYIGSFLKFLCDFRLNPGIDGQMWMVLTTFDFDMAQLPVHWEILQVHGTRCCYS